jgi:hypothetical protein
VSRVGEFFAVTGVAGVTELAEVPKCRSVEGASSYAPKVFRPRRRRCFVGGSEGVSSCAPKVFRQNCVH